MKKIGLGLWGSNGHQILNELKNNSRLELLAWGGFDPNPAARIGQDFPAAKLCQSYAELLSCQGLELVSLCSPIREEQAEHAVTALAAGISVYAEKPCAMTEADLERIIAAAAASPAVFHEMAGTVFEQPYWAMRELIQSGEIGSVVQVFAQKSYPMHDRRPFDEKVDGGLLMQNGVHAMRFVEHLTGLEATSISAHETSLGESRPGSDLKMAGCAMGYLNNGGVFTVIMNYLNQPGLGRWGNEEVRVFGTRGMIESIDAGARVQIVRGEEKPVPVDTSAPSPSWFTLVCDHVRGENGFPFSLAQELHPTRMVIRAKHQLIKP